jgi:hypothetical protein
VIEAITAIVVALISASHLWDRRRTRQSQQRVESKQDVVLQKITTNHGLEPYQYLELIGSMDGKIDLVIARQRAATYAQAENHLALEQRIDEVQGALKDHVTVGHRGQTGL